MVTSVIFDPPRGSLNVAVNLCVAPASINGITETGIADWVLALSDFRAVEHPQRIKVLQKIRHKRMVNLLKHNHSMSILIGHGTNISTGISWYLLSIKLQVYKELSLIHLVTIPVSTELSALKIDDDHVG
jgi:hypothetical protein